MNTQALRYSLFVIGVVVGGYLAMMIGNQALTNILALCTDLLNASFLPVVLIVLVVLFAMIREQFGLEDSFIGALRAFALGVGMTAIIPIAVTIGASNIPAARAIFCADCSTPDTISQLIEQGRVDEAYARATTFIESENARLAALPEGTPAQALEFARGCIAKGEQLMARAMYLQTNDDVDALVALNAYDDNSRATCEQIAADINTMLDRVEEQALRVNDADLLQQVRERRERVREIAKKCQPEVLVNIVEVKSVQDQVVVDLQLYSGDDNDQMLTDMSGVLQVWNGSEQLPAQVTERDKDDKVCVILVADSSGSIKDAELEDVRKSVDALNEIRKRGDYFGLVTFGGKDEIANDGLRNDAINRTLINNDGGYTAIWDATLVGIEEMQSNCPPAIDKRYVLLMTDGQDNQSEFMTGESEESRARALHTQAKDAEIDLCVIGVSEDITASGTDKALSELATDCGYRYVDAFSELADEFQSLFGNEQEYYRITLAKRDVGSSKNLSLRLIGTEVTQPIFIP
jgi:hypothetical protein